jgi:hypothetical protein
MLLPPSTSTFFTLLSRINEEKVLSGVVEVEPLICPAEGYRVLSPPIRSWGTGGCRQDLSDIELLLPSILLRPMSSEDDIDLPINAWECSTPPFSSC